ncbi:MAG: hypothetical protein AB1491_05415 [Thermodesulfobacteriota bacterium]
MLEEQVAKEQIGPIFEKLVTMVGVARDAFNRHSQASLESLKKLQGEAGREIKTAMQQIDANLARRSEKERAPGLRALSIINHLEIIGENLGGLADPIAKKIKEGVLFSDKAVSQANYLFDHQSGLLRSLLDVVKTNNEFLKKYVQEEGLKIIQACFDFATEHEARLIEGLCLPQAAPLFLAILDRTRAICQHGVDIALIFGQKA